MTCCSSETTVRTDILGTLEKITRAVETPMQKAIRLAGSEAKLAELTGYTQPAINKAKRKGQPSADMAVAIEHGLQGRITRAELRPDLFGDTFRRAARAAS